MRAKFAGKFSLTTVIAIASLANAPCASAHHSFSAEFDSTKVVNVTGTLVRVSWVNPHVAFYVDSTDDKGKAVTWQFTGLPPATLRRGGIMKEDFKVGERVTVNGYGSKSDHLVGYFKKVTFADNRVVEVGADRYTPADQQAPGK